MLADGPELLQLGDLSVNVRDFGFASFQFL